MHRSALSSLLLATERIFSVKASAAVELSRSFFQANPLMLKGQLEFTMAFARIATISMNSAPEKNFPLANKPNRSKLGVESEADDNAFTLLLKIECRLRKEARDDLKVRMQKTKGNSLPKTLYQSHRLPGGGSSMSQHNG
jgi:hypothetical protein